MKTILVLTDFSENATCAAQAGLMLSGKLHTDLLLYNTCIDYTTIVSAPGGVWLVDEICERKNHSKHGLEALAEGLESLADQLDPEDRIPAINWQSDDTDLGLDVADIIQHHNVELVVMGARSGSKDDLLPGEDTKAIINNANRPVFIIPAKTDLKQVRKVMYATDFNEADTKAIHYLVKLGKLFHLQLEIIHISDPHKNEPTLATKEAAFKEQIARLNYKGLSYRLVNGKDVTKTLDHLINEAGAGILAMLHRQHSFFVRLFEHSETKKALSKQNIPLLVFPSKMA